MAIALASWRDRPPTHKNMTFDIREHVTLNDKGRGQCPNCLIQGKTGLNLAVFPGTKPGLWAYKCYRSCTSADIRAALGLPAPGHQVQLPPATVAATTTTRPVTVTTDKVDQAHQRLMEQSTKALAWLLARGIPRDAIVHYQLGITRAKIGDSSAPSKFRHLPSITIPIPAPGADKWFNKKRVSPWLEKEKRPDGYRSWSQYGIPQMVFTTHQPENPAQTWLCEGEWDAIALGWLIKNSPVREEIQVSCFTCGASNVPQDASEQLRGEIIVWYDRDTPGELGAAKVAQALKERTRIATVPAPEGYPDGWDISDALDYGTTLATLLEIANDATAWEPPKRENPLRERLQTNAQLIATAPDHIEWLVPDLLTEDELFILAAPPRGGKSIFAMTLAKAIATGNKFLGRPTTQGSVLYVNCEDSPAKVRTRQESMGWAEDLPVYWMDKFKLSELTHLEGLIDELPDLRLIILDTLSRVRDDNNKESSAELSRVLEPLQELAKNRGICILVTHHTGKLGDVDKTDPFDALRGSSSIRATARGVMMIMTGENSHRLLSENGHTEKLDLSLRLNPATIEWQMMGNWAPIVSSTLKDEVLEHLNRVGQGEVSQIARDLGRNARSVGNALSKLHGDEMVEKVAGGGRKPAVYKRSFTSLHTMGAGETKSEACDVDRERDSALLHTIQEECSPPEKVIILEKGDHENDPNDHLLTTTGGKRVKQSPNPGTVRDVCFTDPCETNKSCETKWNKITGGDLVKCVTTSKRYRICGEKQLEVLAVTAKGNAILTTDGWAGTKSIPVTELIKLTS